MNEHHVVIDLETMGTSPGSAIVAIGAVSFTDKAIDGHFYQRVCLKSCTDAGLTIDPDTVMWWLKQSDEARLEIAKPGEPLAEVLQAFTEWITARNLVVGGVLRVWGNGPTLDLALLEESYKVCHRLLPWSFRDERCFRTMRAMFPEVEVNCFDGVAHHALSDAQWQADHLIRIFDYIKAAKP